MYLQLKSIFKNKFTIFMLFLSVFLSFFVVYFSYVSTENSLEIHLRNVQTEYLNRIQDLENEKLERGNNLNPDDENYFKYLELSINSMKINYESIIDKNKYSDEFIENHELVNLLFLLNSTANPLLDQKVASELYQDQIKKYVDLDFDIKSLEYIVFKSDDYIREYHEPVYQNVKMSLDRAFYLLDNNMKELDFTSKSPWSYLSNTYGSKSIKSYLFAPLIVLFSSFLVLNSKNEKTFDLVLTKKNNKFRIFINYIILGIITSLIVFFISDILSVLYYGIRYGFEGLSYPIPVYKDTFSSFSTYDNLDDQYLARRFGLGIVYALPKDFLVPYLPQNLTNISNLEFFIYSFTLEAIKIAMFSVLGTSIGFAIKNKIGVLLTSVGFVLFILASRFIKALNTTWNIFSINSGWNHALGWTQTSWLWGMLLGLLTIGICIFISYNIYSKRDLI